MWDKCRHGLARGSAVGVVWVSIHSSSFEYQVEYGSELKWKVALTFGIQRKFFELFLNK